MTAHRVRNGGRIERLTPEDEVVLWPDALWPQENAALLILESPPRLDTFKALVAAHLHAAPRLRQRLVVPPRRLGAPLWVDDRHFELSRHVRSRTVESPGGQEELLARVEEIRRIRLDRRHPLWDLTVLTGLADGRAAVLLRSHHVLADGVATAALFLRILAAPQDKSSPRPWTPSAPPTGAELRADHRSQRAARRRAAFSRLLRPRELLKGLRGTAALLSPAQPHSAPSLNRTVGAGRSFALVDFDLARVADAGHWCGGTVNDVLLAMAGAGARRILPDAERNHVLELDVFVPVSLRTGAEDRANLISEFPVPVPIGKPDARTRLSLIAARTRVLKAQPHPSLGVLLRSRAVRWIFRRFVAPRLHPVNVTTANLRGPTESMKVAGIPILAIHPLVALVANVTIAVGAVSYAGRFFVGITADAGTVPDLVPFADAMRAELDALSRAPQC